MKNSQRITVCVMICSAACSLAQAKPLNLNMLPSPDVTSGFIDVNYDAGLDNLLIAGFSLSFYDGVTTSNIGGNDTFNINATVNSSGVGTAGTLNIQGMVNGMGPNLLQGTLLPVGGFGAENGPAGGLGDNDILEFLFAITGGDMAPLYGGIGATVGTVLDANNNDLSDGTWDHNWSNSASGGVADTAPPVPEPSTLALLSICGASLIRRRGR